MPDVPSKIIELIEKFDRNREQYLNPAFNEAQTRVEFIDPFFEALGWDIYNKSGYSEAYKDVIHEDAIKVGGVNTKTPGRKTLVQRQIDSTDHDIDKLVYELYDLTEEEIKIVEESA